MSLAPFSPFLLHTGEPHSIVTNVSSDYFSKYRYCLLGSATVKTVLITTLSVNTVNLSTEKSFRLPMFRKASYKQLSFPFLMNHIPTLRRTSKIFPSWKVPALHRLPESCTRNKPMERFRDAIKNVRQTSIEWVENHLAQALKDKMY